MAIIKTDNQPATKEHETKDVQPRDAKGNWKPPDVSDVKTKEFMPRPGFKQPNRPAYDKKVFLNTSMLPRAGDDEAKQKREMIMQQQAEAKKAQAPKKAGRPPKKV